VWFAGLKPTWMAVCGDSKLVAWRLHLGSVGMG
jgi:hypothetical protein